MFTIMKLKYSYIFVVYVREFTRLTVECIRWQGQTFKDKTPKLRYFIDERRRTRRQRKRKESKRI
jgi:hypothetical protein